MIDELLAERLLREAGDEIHVTATEPDEVLRAGRRSRRRHQAMGAVLTAAAAVAAVVVVVPLVGTGTSAGPAVPSGTVTRATQTRPPAPSVVGLTPREAAEKLGAAGWGWVNVQAGATDSCDEAGRVISQETGEWAARSLVLGYYPPTLPGCEWGDVQAATNLSIMLAYNEGFEAREAGAIAPRLTVSAGGASRPFSVDQWTGGRDWVVGGRSPFDILQVQSMSVLELSTHEPPTTCAGQPDALPAGEITPPDITAVMPDTSCATWGAVDIWLDSEGRIRHVNVRSDS